MAIRLTTRGRNANRDRLRMKPKPCRADANWQTVQKKHFTQKSSAIGSEHEAMEVERERRYFELASSLAVRLKSSPSEEMRSLI